jgi:hypothetical protein
MTAGASLPRWVVEGAAYRGAIFEICCQSRCNVSASRLPKYGPVHGIETLCRRSLQVKNRRFLIYSILSEMLIGQPFFSADLEDTQVSRHDKSSSKGLGEQGSDINSVMVRGWSMKEDYHFH